MGAIRDLWNLGVPWEPASARNWGEAISDDVDVLTAGGSAAYVAPGDDAATLGSGVAADGHVLTADGLGGAAFEAVAGGGLTATQEAAFDLHRLAFGDPLTGTGSLGAGWTERLGTWALYANGARATATSGGVAVATVAQTGPLDLAQTGWCTSNNSYTTGAVPLYVDADNYVYVEVNTTQIRIYEVVAGVETQLAVSDNLMRTGSRFNRLHVSVVNGNFVHAYVGHRPGTVVAAAVTSALATGTVGCGIWTRNNLTSQLVQSFAVRSAA